jgi:DNA-binding Xre family transcriptional regulator
METKLKKLLKRRRLTQKKLYDNIAKRYETPIGQYALSEIVSGKKLNYHINTLVKICNVLNVKPQSIVESDELEKQLIKYDIDHNHITRKDEDCE